jgi:hypothetical protein
MNLSFRPASVHGSVVFSPGTAVGGGREDPGAVHILEPPYMLSPKFNYRGTLWANSVHRAWK